MDSVGGNGSSLLIGNKQNVKEFYQVSMGSFEKLAFGLHILGNQHGGPFSDYFTEVNICSFCSL